MAQEKVCLVPWDPEDEQQYQRMYDQRIGCGWREGEVDEWRQKQLGGTKVLYWIVLSDNLPHRDKLLADHVEKYPAEKEPLTDTLKSVNGVPRIPTGKEFIPIGHTALQLCPELIERFGLPSSTVRVTSLYVSWALQSAGFGRSAMSQTERIAAQPPHGATLIVLDTIRREMQLSENYLYLMYDSRGMGRPARVRCNQDWYGSLGYDIVPSERVESYPWRNEATGEMSALPIAWMTKTLVN